MRTPKIEALHFFNARLNEKPQMIKLGLDNSPMGNNPWLAGFIEADGNFYCELGLRRYNKRSKKLYESFSKTIV